MGNRRFAQVTSDDEDEDEADPKPAKRITRSSKNSKETESEPKNKRRKVVKLNDEDDDEKEEKPTYKKESSRRKEDKEGGGGERDGEEDQEVEEQEEEEEEEEPQEEAKPIGNLIRITGKGRGQKKHYDSFEFDGNQYVLEDPVLLVPEETDQKPYVAIIKDITQNKDGSIMVTGQWFYRPEEAQKKGGGSWQSRDTRELFYSFHRDDIPAESVMHKCVVHFVPAHKQLPKRKQHPGFIVQKVYDTVERKLWRLTDKDYEDSKQNEIDLLVKKTMERLGDLPDLEPEEAQINQEDQLKSKRSIRRKNVPPLDVSRDEESNKSDQQPKAETPGSCTGSEYNAILVQFKALTGESHRDKWLEKLLQGVQHICSTDGIDNEKDSKSSDTVNESQDLNSKGVKPFEWPDAALPAIVALEKASHDTLSSDFQKYNQKMRSLAFNLKNNAFLAQRLLKGELEPLKILNMSPSELKEGLTAEETATTEPEESASMQMTDARCSRCNESKVGVRDIIQAGHGDRYQLECTACGHSWYASRDEASTLTIDGPSSTRSVGTAPWATAKFESIEKQLASPRASDLSASGNEALKKSSEAFVPVLERQKSLGKS